MYGFSELIRSNPPECTLRKLFSAHQDVEDKVLSRFSEAVSFTFSDCMFLVFPDADRSKLREFCAAIESILAIFIGYELPLRGGAAYGDVVYRDRFLLGLPVIDAYSYEQLIPAPLVLLPTKELVSKDSAIVPSRAQPVEAVELKGGGIMEGKLIWPTPEDSYLRFVRERSREALVHGPPLVAEAWARANEFVQKRSARQIPGV